jgi:CheY-like chemotaxis protein
MLRFIVRFCDPRKVSPMPSKKVLIVDDEKAIADTLAKILNQSGFSAQAVYDGKSALHQIHLDCPEILLSDVIMPGMNGVDAAKLAVAECPTLKVLFISGQAASLDLVENAKHLGFAFQLLAKPIEPEELIAILQAA